MKSHHLFSNSQKTLQSASQYQEEGREVADGVPVSPSPSPADSAALSFCLSCYQPCPGSPEASIYDPQDWPVGERRPIRALPATPGILVGKQKKLRE